MRELWLYVLSSALVMCLALSCGLSSEPLLFDLVILERDSPISNFNSPFPMDPEPLPGSFEALENLEALHKWKTNLRVVNLLNRGQSSVHEIQLVVTAKYSSGNEIELIKEYIGRLEPGIHHLLVAPYRKISEARKYSSTRKPIEEGSWQKLTLNIQSKEGTYTRNYFSLSDIPIEVTE